VCKGVCGTSKGCTHQASPGSEEYGSDCSGLVSTIWGYPDDDPDTNPTDNGYSTKAYAQDGARWNTVPLSEALPGDALVRYDDARHHIVLIATARDRDGTFNTYECRGCKPGCETYQLTVAENGDWHAIRRRGW